MTAAAGSVESGAGVDDAAVARARRLQRLAAVLGVAAIFEAAAITYFGSLGDPRFVFGLDLITAGFLGIVMLFPVMGALIAQRRPATRVAWLMIALGLGLGFGLVTYAYGVVGQPPARSLPFATPSLVLSQLFFVPTIGAATTWILLLYPTDRLLGRRWAWAGILSLVGAVIYSVGGLVRPGDLDPVAVPGLRNPLAIEGDLGWFLYSMAEVGNLVGLGGLVLGAGSLIVRYRHADLVVAAQIRWLALAAVLGAATLGLSLLPMPDELQLLNNILFGLGLSFIACMPIAIGIAITRYRLYDIDRLINRALVYGSLTAILAGVFTAGVGLAQRIFVAVTNETSDAAIVGTTLVVATLYAPLRKRLEAIVDRRFKFEEARFGSYRDELTKYLALTDPSRATQRLVEQAVGEMEATGGAVVEAGDRVVASVGMWPMEPAIRIALRGGDPGRALVVGGRMDGRPHDERAVAALEEVAALASAAMAAPGPRS